MRKKLIKKFPDLKRSFNLLKNRVRAKVDMEEAVVFQAQPIKKTIKEIIIQWQTIIPLIH